MTGKLPSHLFCYQARLSTHYSVITAHKQSLGQGNIFTGVCPWGWGGSVPDPMFLPVGSRSRRVPILGVSIRGRGSVGRPPWNQKSGLSCSRIFFTFSKSVHPSRCKINRKSNIACISIQVTLYLIRLIIAQINNIKE